MTSLNVPVPSLLYELLNANQYADIPLLGLRARLTGCAVLYVFTHPRINSGLYI